ncbi:MAG: hypothetical protein QM594_11705 [Niabella sp.]
MKTKYIFLLLIGYALVLNALGQKHLNESHIKLKAKGDIPRLAWYSIPASESNLQRYHELKEAGITITFSFFPSFADAQKSLELARQVGVRVIVSCPELKAEPESTVKKLMNHPALAGYFLRDEPSKSEFAELAKWVRRIQAVDNSHFCYINMLPIYAEGWQFETPKEQDTLVTTYQDYLTSFIKQIPVEFLTYDAYCVIGDTLRYNYYENLEIVAEEAKKAQKDFWAFALTTGSSIPVNFPPPTLAELRFQIYSILAYGAQGVQYFTYWTPSPGEADPWDFHEGPIGLDGKRTVTYDRLKQMNEEVKNLSGVFYGGKVLSARHVGESIPKGTRRLQKLPHGIKVLETHGAGALVSIIENESHLFAVIVNRSFKKPMPLTIYGDEGLMRVQKDGSMVPAHLYSSNIEVDPGDAVIYKLPSAGQK